LKLIQNHRSLLSVVILGVVCLLLVPAAAGAQDDTGTGARLPEREATVPLSSWAPAAAGTRSRQTTPRMTTESKERWFCMSFKLNPPYRTVQSGLPR
jgi:hypothetical protein